MYILRATYRRKSGQHTLGWLFVLIFFLSQIGLSQECPSQVLTSPLNGAVNVAVDTNISWNQVANIPAYIISLGTTPGGTDILNEKFVGSATTYDPPLGLPENTLIYVTISLFDYQNGNIEIPCVSESFTTASITEIPDCNSLNIPAQGAVNVNPSTNISWNYSSGALGYRLTIGTAPGGNDLLNNADLGNNLYYDPVPELPPNQIIYVRIVPYNLIGDALGCTEYNFTTSAIAILP
ncbi:Ig-like domain-containing protein, partial [uncultured Muriicola sp.]|uniref:Ig-like domain-containing protein n=1 Tax=uncultured Muriicola sp. TaxID=1583102 RepID=UPI002602FF71